MNARTRQIARSARRAAGLVAVVATGILLAGCNPEAGVARDLEAACAEGDAGACNDLGWRVSQGAYVLADWRRASDLFEQACEDGEGLACVRLGRMQIDPSAPNRGVRIDSMSASALFEQGCDAGTMVGCTDMAGLLLDRGRPDTTSAASFLERACDGEDMGGCTQLGSLIGLRLGSEGDPTREVALHQRACDAGLQIGCVNLGYAHERGVGAEPDAARAATLYEAACEEEMWGCHRLAGLHVRGAGVDEDIERAVELYRQACRGTQRRDEGSPSVPESCFLLGDLIVSGVTDLPLWRATEYFRAACRRGHDEACERV